MEKLKLEMPGQEFIETLNTNIGIAAASGGGGTSSTISRTLSLQMQKGKMDSGFITRNTSISSDDDFDDYCHSVLMLGIESCTLVSVGKDNNETMTIFCYGYDDGGSLEYLGSVPTASNFPTGTCYIKIMLYKSGGYSTVRQLDVTLIGKPTLVKNITSSLAEPQFFSFGTAFPSIAEADTATDSYLGAGGNVDIDCYDNGFIVLPPNYTVAGPQVPLILYCHDKDELKWNTQALNSKNLRIFEFLANNGYAVCDCYGLTSNYKTQGNAYFAPSYVSSISCLLKFIYANYNVKTDGIYVCGKSSGAFISTLLPQLFGFKVKAAAGLSPFPSALIGMRFGDTTYGITSFANVIWQQLNITKATSSTPAYVSEDLGAGSGNHILDTYTAYLNATLLRRYDALFKSTNLSEEELCSFVQQLYISNVSSLDTLYSGDMVDVMDNIKITMKCPVKLWCSDGDTSIASYAKWFVTWCKNGGSPAYLRKFPASSGSVQSHDLVDTNSGTGALTVSYTPKFGSSTTEAIAICEMVDWFNQW